jgi:GNAT superfamily N-acetyltransferase
MRFTLADLKIEDVNHDQHLIDAFDCADTDLNEFLKTDCKQYATHQLAHTKVALYQGEVVGFCCLSTDSISLDGKEPWFGKDIKGKLKHIPALKIGRLGTISKLQKSGIGKCLMRYAIGVAFRVNQDNKVGCRFITVDAYPDSVPFYERIGFIKSQHKNYRKKTNVAMYYDIIDGQQF